MAEVILYGVLVNLILQVFQVLDQLWDVFDIKEHVVYHPLLGARLSYGKLVVSDVFLVAWLTNLWLNILVKSRDLRFL